MEEIDFNSTKLTEIVEEKLRFHAFFKIGSRALV